jgi:hypothetical protein
MFGTRLLEMNSKEMRLSRRDLLLGIAVAGTVALPMLSTPVRAAVSMLRTGLDPDLVETENEIIPVKRGGGGKGRGGKGHSRGKGRGGSRSGSRSRGRGRGGGHRYYGRGRGRGRRYYGGYGGYWGCRNPWYRRRYWYRCYL